MSLFPSNAYDAWKTNPDPEPEPELEGYDPDAENDANYFEDENDESE